MKALDHGQAIRELAFVDAQIALLQRQREGILWKAAGIKRGDIVEITDWRHRGALAKADELHTTLEPGKRPFLIGYLEVREGWAQHRTDIGHEWVPAAKGVPAPNKGE